MKINEKNLAQFAVAKTPVDREGWLLKRGEVNKSFQRRWFTLKGNLLFYFEKKGDKDPIGLIILEGCTIELAENEELFAFKIMFHSAGNRTYILSADSQENMESWMKALACASYDYMKLMVAELQRQLDEVNEAERKRKPKMSPPQPLRNSLPVNRSDSCLCRHQVAGGNQRFNPFNTKAEDLSKSDATEDEKKTTNDNSTKLMGSKQSFIELHEYYGRHFRKIFEEQKHKRYCNNLQQLE
ncbi:sesquipedalian-1-like [Tachypleus tridentatus]|uniref:sesquipedalian-1-like n=1 Tax=Tachypleus tridentatus TaxID=6853 RepID=UPI003FD56B69